MRKLSYRSGFSSVFESEEEVFPSYVGFMMTNALKDVIHFRASQLHESGIIWHFIKQESDFKSKPEEIGPQVLKLEHLKAGFVIICGLLGASVFVFAIECLSKLLKKALLWFSTR
jgi:hypothetical protein